MSKELKEIELLKRQLHFAISRMKDIRRFSVG